MEFIHEPYLPEETIAAVATPPGEGGVAIIRISGKTAIEVAEKVFSGPIRSYKTHTAHFGHIHDKDGVHIDDVLLIPMLGTRSYTGENTIEIHCHGGSLITRRVLDAVLDAGARAARPGEFTFRAYINGKIDLAQAEAVQELIGAKNERALDAAENQLQGRLSEKVLSFQEQLTGIAAILEAWVDFPDEGLEFASMEQVCADLAATRDQMIHLESTYHDGKILHDGISLCLIGCPNVGKSSLMNALLDKDRAIVTHIAGTTRDILEDHLRLNGLNFRLIDTAGIRKEAEFIELEGIRRSKQAMESADLILLVLDASRGIEDEDLALIEQVAPEKTIVIWNKIDLVEKQTNSDLSKTFQLKFPCMKFPHIVYLSAKNKIGLSDLHKAIDEIIWKEGPPSREEILITNIRHKEALAEAIRSCDQVICGLRDNLSPEFITLDMRHCLMSLGKIIGTNINEDILSSIFSKFCIGK